MISVAFGRRALAAVISCAALTTAPARAEDPITHAQPLLHMETVVVVTRSGPHRFRAEIADTPQRQEIGLMYRPPLRADRGMLFELGAPQEADFWMEHCAHPLDMLFIAADGRIRSIARNTKPFSRDAIDSGGPVTAVLEIRGGRAAEIGAKPGDLVRHAYFGDE